jgi:hypothetical protein
MLWLPALLCAALALPSSPSAPVESNDRQTDAPPETAADGPDHKPPTPAHTGFRALVEGLGSDIAHLPSKENLYTALAGGALAAGAGPLDVTVNTRLRNHYDTVNAIFGPGKYYGDTPEQMAFSIGTWALGRMMDKPKLSHLGMDLLRAQALTEIMVEPVKFATRRERPDGSNSQSFPSGHAAITFAAAAVIERHLGWKHSIWAYGIASYVAASRLHDNKHYLSDVVFGAAVGSIAGRTVTRHGREAWSLGAMALPGGVAITVTRN